MKLEKEALDKYLNQYVEILKNLYKDKLEKVILFGSYARGDARDDSDIDVFAVIDMDEDSLVDLHSKLLDDTWDFMCDNDYIHIQILDMCASYYNRYKNIETLFRNINEDGVVYYKKKSDIGDYLDIAKAKMIESKEILEDAKMLLDNQRYMSAANRIYYSVFKAISALHFLEGNKFKKHKDALGQFNKLYIHTGIFPKEFGRKIYKIESAREEADYSVRPKLTKEMLEEYLDFATKFIETIKNYCKKRLQEKLHNNQQQANMQR